MRKFGFSEYLFTVCLVPIIDLVFYANKYLIDEEDIINYLHIINVKISDIKLKHNYGTEKAMPFPSLLMKDASEIGTHYDMTYNYNPKKFSKNISSDFIDFDSKYKMFNLERKG